MSPCMDDIKISSETFEEHLEEVNLVNETARGDGFEFKLKKGQFNQESIEFWGCVVDGDGRWPQEKKVEQLRNWPEPVDQAAVNSFLCFVNYLREYLPPTWVEKELVLRPFRKKGCEFRKLWNGDPKYKEAFFAIRGMMAENVVVHHVDHVAASRPHESGRPLEMFIDASDYGWAAVLCQRPEPGKAPQSISVIAKGVFGRAATMVRDGARTLRTLARRCQSRTSDYGVQVLLLC